MEIFNLIVLGKPHALVERFQRSGLCYMHACVVLQHCSSPRDSVEEPHTHACNRARSVEIVPRARVIFPGLQDLETRATQTITKTTEKQVYSWIYTSSVSTCICRTGCTRSLRFFLNHGEFCLHDFHECCRVRKKEGRHLHVDLVSD